MARSLLCIPYAGFPLEDVSFPVGAKETRGKLEVTRHHQPGEGLTL